MIIGCIRDVKSAFQALISYLIIINFQLRSLYPDKEHEAKYTELVREYLDFDVEMEHVGAFWGHSESQITQYNKEQNILRAKQKMLKEDWEKFKVQRNEVKNKIMGKKASATDNENSEILSAEG